MFAPRCQQGIAIPSHETVTHIQVTVECVDDFQVDCSREIKRSARQALAWNRPVSENAFN
jgi:hypothetical protein